MKRPTIILLALGLAAIAFFAASRLTPVQTFLIDRRVADIDKDLGSYNLAVVEFWPTEEVQAVIAINRLGAKLQRVSVRYFGGDRDGESTAYYFESSGKYVVFVKEGEDDKSFGYLQDGDLIKWTPSTVGLNTKQTILDSDWNKISEAIEPRLAWVQIKPLPLDSFLIDKEFLNPCEAGEQGVFEQGGSLRVNLTQDLFNEGERQARWEVDDDSLTISGSFITDDTFGDFFFEEKEGEVVAFTGQGAACGITIGTDMDVIEDFESVHSRLLGEGSLAD
ncbi:hypothetical protein HYT59_01625 [Candidatus Woesebacteria bacterium]|nr:hypothetical protein [Candidatus Woesebacteria bacterium]